ncbi:Asp-tRNA(Asn)/Glu-tRNA(Gln) amidotransferase subunit GatC [Luteolibacter sp. LG18]|uniref:Asp-tRNA(Asn)/Glu-tRNA(Gln) amidotransferase subunit GatC n=1 Tax=Luteolibacter sp. LG18 TaxID=2819286 RepID=UPI002B30F73F|nr:aspartyl/glutamyl-tRNA(Asn/Gln) amidotransferase subunit C [Luteolibacter sp. LG18]
MSNTHIDDRALRNIATLARLELNDEEIATFKGQLEDILGYVDTISKLDVSGIEPTSYPAPVFDRMRDDVPHESLSREAMLQNAPEQAQHQIRVPKVIAEA